MKVAKKQRNSRMCIMCGLDNEYGVRAPFYSMEDGSVVTLFKYRAGHQSYPLRVHGGLISAMLDEIGLRSLWSAEGSEDTFAVTTSLETKYRKPVPYDVDLIGKAEIVKQTAHFFTANAVITDYSGTVLASGTMNYIKLSPDKIAQNISVHEEMCYLIDDGVKEISL